MDLDLWLRMYSVSRPTLVPNVLSRYRFHERAKCIAGETARKAELVRVLAASKVLSEAAFAALVDYSEEHYALKRKCSELEQRIERVKQHVVLGRVIKWWTRYVNRTLSL
jgi:hypothetical protein